MIPHMDPRWLRVVLANKSKIFSGMTRAPLWSSLKSTTHTNVVFYHLMILSTGGAQHGANSIGDICARTSFHQRLSWNPSSQLQPSGSSRYFTWDRVGNLFFSAAAAIITHADEASLGYYVQQELLKITKSRRRSSAAELLESNTEN